MNINQMTLIETYGAVLRVREAWHRKKFVKEGIPSTYILVAFFIEEHSEATEYWNT